MGKNGKADFQSMSDLMEEKKKLEKKIAQTCIPCSHTNSNGKLKVEFFGSNYDCRCKKCGAKFNFAQVAEKNAKDAVAVVHDMINQIKALSEDPEKESKVINQLGNLDYNLTELFDLYLKTLSNNSRNKGGKKKHDNDNAFGSYGLGGLKF